MHAEGLEKMKSVKLPKVSQIGIVVPDIGKAVRHYSKILNIKPWFRSKTTSNDAAFKGESFSLELDIALAFSGGMEIELIQMLTDRECIYSDIMKKQGGGLHHIGAMVRAFDRKLDQMAEYFRKERTRFLVESQEKEAKALTKGTRKAVPKSVAEALATRGEDLL